MKTLNFSININAPKEKKWKTLWDDTTYRQWTRIFSEGSYAVSDWNEGSRVLFLSAEGELVSRRAGVEEEAEPSCRDDRRGHQRAQQ